MQLGPSETASYTGAVVSIGSSLTLTGLGIIVGMVTAILTFAVSTYFAWRRDRREEREARARLEELKDHIKGESWRSDEKS